MHTSTRAFLTLVVFPLAILLGCGSERTRAELSSGQPPTKQPASTPEKKSRPPLPLILYPACPCYHRVGEGSGATRLDARIALSPAQRAGATLAVTVTDPAGKVVHTATTSVNQGEVVGVDFEIPVKAVATYTAEARLRDATGREIASARTDIGVIPPELSEVRVGPDGFLRVAGQPHFPLGLYASGRFEEMAAAGFSATHSYAITTGEAQDPVNVTDGRLKDLLDRSWRNGLRMMVELPRLAIEQAQWGQVRRRIETFRHHPGLLCWGSEERVARGRAPLAHLATLYRMVKELDPHHPLVVGDTRDVIGKFKEDRRDFFPDACMDVGIWWWYPIPMASRIPSLTNGPGFFGSRFYRDPNGVLQPPSWLTTTRCKKPLWIAIQAYQKPKPTARFPTPEEYRAMAYLSLINGVKGLFFYTGYGQRDYYGKPAGLLNKPAEGRWDYVQQLARELRALSPVIMGAVPEVKVTLSPPEAPVEFALRMHEGALYLLAANKSLQPQAVRFSSRAFAGKRVTVLHEPHTAKVPQEQETFAGVFGPLGVRVYQLR